MKLTFTERGFSYFEFRDDNGDDCTMQQSSAVCDEGMMWLGRTGAEGSMHLSQSTVAEMLPVLQHFAETGDIEEPPEEPGLVKKSLIFALNAVMFVALLVVIAALGAVISLS